MLPLPVLNHATGNESQGALLRPIQTHLSDPAIENLPLPPAAATEVVLGFSVNAQVPFCARITVFPARYRATVRGEAPP